MPWRSHPWYAALPQRAYPCLRVRRVTWRQHAAQDAPKRHAIYTSHVPCRPHPCLRVRQHGQLDVHVVLVVINHQHCLVLVQQHVHLLRRATM